MAWRLSARLWLAVLVVFAAGDGEADLGKLRSREACVAASSAPLGRAGFGGLGSGLALPSAVFWWLNAREAPLRAAFCAVVPLLGAPEGERFGVDGAFMGGLRG